MDSQHPGVQCTLDNLTDISSIVKMIYYRHLKFCDDQPTVVQCLNALWTDLQGVNNTRM